MPLCWAITGTTCIRQLPRYYHIPSHFTTFFFSFFPMYTNTKGQGKIPRCMPGRLCLPRSSLLYLIHIYVAYDKCETPKIGESKARASKAVGNQQQQAATTIQQQQQQQHQKQQQHQWLTQNDMVARNSNSSWCFRFASLLASARFSACRSFCRSVHAPGPVVLSCASVVFASWWQQHFIFNTKKTAKKYVRRFSLIQKLSYTPIKTSTIQFW